MVSPSALICIFILLVLALADSSGCSLPSAVDQLQANEPTECALEGEGCLGQHSGAALVQRHAIKTWIGSKQAQANAPVAINEEQGQLATVSEQAAGVSPVAIIPILANSRSSAPESNFVHLPEPSVNAAPFRIRPHFDTQKQDIAQEGGGEQKPSVLGSEDHAIISGSATTPEGVKGSDYKAENLTDIGIGKQTQLAKAEVPSIGSGAEAAHQSDSTNGINSADAEVADQVGSAERPSDQTRPKEAEESSTMEDLKQLLQGRPKVWSVFIIMLLPAGICTIMYCVFSVISSLEEDGVHGAAHQPVTMLGEEVPRMSGFKRGYEPLCPELLAPSDNECFIALPSLVGVNLGASMIERMIVSKTGTHIVRITVARVSDGVPDVAGGGSCAGSGQSLERISLIAYRRQNALGFCELQVPSTSQPMKCCIYRPSGELFATLEEESSGAVSSLLSSGSGSGALHAAPSFGAKCYMLTTVATAARLWIRGDFTNRNLAVVNEIDQDKAIIKVDSGQQLQFKGDKDNHYRLRVQPKVDAGVVIMALLAIDRLPSSYRT